MNKISDTNKITLFLYDYLLVDLSPLKIVNR